LVDAACLAPIRKHRTATLEIDFSRTGGWVNCEQQWLLVVDEVTVENRLGFLATLVRHGQKELVEDMVLNPFERIDVTTTLNARKPKNRWAHATSELNTLFNSQL